jgi:GNAT superfamily N-acetyltransferase
MDLLKDAKALKRVSALDITDLTRAATEATFYEEPLSDAQIAANRRVVDISAPTCASAAANSEQVFIAALMGSRFAGYVIGTRHSAESHELDWLMVHPDFHGSDVSRLLMDAGLDWLGRNHPTWLSVIQFNRRAIRFYEKFGFVIDPEAKAQHVVPHFIMRRLPG